jgi:AraC family transcriptional regulator of arabinose operon
LPLQAEEVKEQVKRSLVDMHRLATRGIPQSERLAMNALEAALLWCDLENPIGTSARIDARVRKAIEYIITDLTRHLALDVLARHCGLSRSRLSDLFRAQLGMSPQQFQEQHRMERARHLLALTSRSVAEIAVEVGFASQFYFSLRFKKLWGVSPKAYRKRESSRPTAAVGGSSRPRPN